MRSREASLREVSTALEAARGSAELRAMRAEALDEFERGERRQRSRAIAWRLAAGVAVFVLGAAAYRLVFPPSGHSDANFFITQIGEQRTIRLADNSTVTLNTDSALRIRFDDSERRAELLRGQALFGATQDARRPFVVSAGDSLVRALGTEFDVRKRERDVVVTLIAGRVRVEAQGPKGRGTRELAPGERVQVSALGLSQVHSVDTDKAAAWTGGHLIFENEPLESAVAEVNRYSRVRVRLGGEASRSVRVSGVFRTGSSAGFVEALEASYPIRASRTTDGTEVVLEPR